MKDKGFKITLIIYTTLLLADLVSTLMNYELIQYLEANPIYKYGGLPLILFVNTLLIFVFIYWYKRANVDTRYYILFTLIAVNLTRIIAIKGNISIWLNPPTIAQAMAVTTAEKIEYTKRLVLLNVLPFFTGIFTYFFYKIDHDINKKEG